MRRAIIVGLLATTACAGASGGYSGRTGSDAVAALYDRIGMHGDTPAAVRRSLGEPLRVDRNTVPNRHGYGTDTAITMVHPRWRHEFLALGASGNVLLLGAETTDPTVTFPGGITIGTTTGEVARTRLGPPEAEEARGDSTIATWRHPTHEAESYVELAVLRDTVRLLRWVPYVD